MGRALGARGAVRWARCLRLSWGGSQGRAGLRMLGSVAPGPFQLEQDQRRVSPAAQHSVLHVGCSLLEIVRICPAGAGWSCTKAREALAGWAAGDTRPCRGSLALERFGAYSDAPAPSSSYAMSLRNLPEAGGGGRIVQTAKHYIRWQRRRRLSHAGFCSALGRNPNDLGFTKQLVELLWVTPAPPGHGASAGHVDATHLGAIGGCWCARSCRCMHNRSVHMRSGDALQETPC